MATLAPASRRMHGADQAAGSGRAGKRALRAAGLCKSYGERQVLDDVSLEVSAGRIVAMLGPSGSGKSTVGEILAGTITCDRGKLLLDSQDLLSLPTHQRGIALAPQEWELFPHLTAAENVAFGAWASRKPRTVREQLGRAWLDRVGLLERAASYPHQLSGGQQQRVALARALAAGCGFVVLDEPFANVDQATRHHLRELLQREVEEGLGILFITHDRNDALMIADDVVCLMAGKVLMRGTPEQVYKGPTSLAAARLTGEADLLPAHLVHPDVHLPLAAPGEHGDGRVIVRPEWLTPAADQRGDFKGRTTAVDYGGGFYIVTLDVGGAAVRLHADCPPELGTELHVTFRNGFRPRALGEPRN